MYPATFTYCPYIQIDTVFGETPNSAAVNSASAICTRRHGDAYSNIEDRNRVVIMSNYIDSNVPIEQSTEMF